MRKKILKYVEIRRIKRCSIELFQDVLQKTQDAFLRQKEDLREKLTREQQTNAQLKKEIKLRDQQIEELTKDQKELQIQREKRVALMQERDFLQQQLSERQTITRVRFRSFILSMKIVSNRRTQIWKLNSN
jgi:hypothetical protein